MKLTINQRVVSYCEYKKIRQVDLILAGYAAKQTISNIWNEKSKPSCEFLERLITQNSDLNARWLLSGKGEMLEPIDNIDSSTMIKYLEDKLKDKERLISDLNQEIGSLRTKLEQK